MVNSSTVFGYRQVATLQQGIFDKSLHQTTHFEDFLTSTSSTKLNRHHVEFFFIFHTLICFHGVHGFPRAIHAVNGRVCECTQVFPVANSGVPVHAVHASLMRPYKPTRLSAEGMPISEYMPAGLYAHEY